MIQDTISAVTELAYPCLIALPLPFRDFLSIIGAVRATGLCLLVAYIA